MHIPMSHSDSQEGYESLILVVALWILNWKATVTA